MNSIQIRTKINQWWCVPVLISAGWVEFVVRNVDPITIGEQHAQHTCVCSYEPNFTDTMLRLQCWNWWNWFLKNSLNSCDTCDMMEVLAHAQRRIFWRLGSSRVTSWNHCAYVLCMFVWHCFHFIAWRLCEHFCRPQKFPHLTRRFLGMKNELHNNEVVTNRD